MKSMIYGTLFLFIACCSCKKENGGEGHSKGGHMLGIHVTETATLDFEKSFKIAMDAGMDCVPQVIYWNMLEQDGKYDPDQLLEIINLFYPAYDMAVSLCISPIAAISRAVPNDLEMVSFSDPQMIDRFKRLLDTVYKKTPNLDIQFLLLGNEVDLYFSAHPEQWEDYISFTRDIVPYAKQYWEGIRIGVETTLGGATGPNKDYIKDLNKHTDIICFSYYPINADFTMKPIEEVKPAIGTILDLYQGRAMFLEECGYATSEVCNSSEEAQAAFVEEMFKIWDENSSQLLYVGFLWLHDIPDETAWHYVKEYGMKGRPHESVFKEYLRTCGLRTASGKEKKGFQTLKDMALERGW